MRIPIRAAKDIAKEFGQRQVILLTWDGERTHVVTYGKSVNDCDQAAEGGNRIKKFLGWPEGMCNDRPSRVQLLENKVRLLEEKLEWQQKES